MYELPKKLNSKNIESVIAKYNVFLENLPVKVEEANSYKLYKLLKREKKSYPPYLSISFFEAANRIMTDLVIIHGVKKLLETKIFCGIETTFSEFLIEYGNESTTNDDGEVGHDIYAVSLDEKYILKGEAFNVAKDFFQAKKSKMLKKLRESTKDKDKEILILLYNSDAVNPTYQNKKVEKEEHFVINLDSIYL